MRNARALFACAAIAAARAEPASAADLERGFWRSLSGASGAIYVRYNADRDYHAVGSGYWSPLSDRSGTVLLDEPVFMDEGVVNKDKWDAIKCKLHSRFCDGEAVDGTPDGDDDAVEAVFANEGDEAVRLFWLGPDGDVAVGSAAPGASFETWTFHGHEFAAKLEGHDEAYATYTIGAARRQTFRVRNEARRKWRGDWGWMARRTEWNDVGNIVAEAIGDAIGDAVDDEAFACMLKCCTLLFVAVAVLVAFFLAMIGAALLCVILSVLLDGAAYLQRLWDRHWYGVNGTGHNTMVINVQMPGEPETRLYFQVGGFMPLEWVLKRYRKELRRWPFPWLDRGRARALRLTFQGRSDIEQETAWSLGLQDGGALVATVNPVGARVLDAREQVPFLPNERG